MILQVLKGFGLWTLTHLVAGAGDHLPTIVRGRILTRPQWCIAGWVEAVPFAAHRKRTVKLSRARAAIVTVERFEKLEAQTRKDAKKLDAMFAALARKKIGAAQKEEKESKLKQIKAQLARRQAAATTVRERSDEEILKEGWLTCDLDERLPFGSASDDPADNEYLDLLVVSANCGDKRKKLLAMTIGWNNRLLRGQVRRMDRGPAMWH
jgi:hypothetical protein